MTSGKGLFEGYELGVAWDEMFAAPSQPRKLALELCDTLHSLSPSEFEVCCAERDRSLRDRGITFALFGEELPFPLDPVARLIEVSVELSRLR
jgi:uncharacterized circularly permuted ATP-grasp superfamily protein